MSLNLTNLGAFDFRAITEFFEIYIKWGFMKQSLQLSFLSHLLLSFIGWALARVSFWHMTSKSCWGLKKNLIFANFTLENVFFLRWKGGLRFFNFFVFKLFIESHWLLKIKMIIHCYAMISGGWILILLHRRFSDCEKWIFKIIFRLLLILRIRWWFNI